MATGGATTQTAYGGASTQPRQNAMTQGYDAVRAASLGHARNSAQATTTGTSYDPATMGKSKLVRNTDLSEYTNPYEDQVVSRALADLERSRHLATDDIASQATVAGAWGGSRHGVADALTNEAYAEQAADTAATLRQGGYDQATTLAGQDADRKIRRAEYNHTARNDARRFGAVSDQSALDRSSSSLDALSRTGQTMYEMGRTTNQDSMSAGSMQQALDQLLIDSANREYANFLDAPNRTLDLPLRALGGAKYGHTTTTTQTHSPGLGGVIGGLGNFYANTAGRGIWGMFGGGA